MSNLTFYTLISQSSGRHVRPIRVIRNIRVQSLFPLIREIRVRPPPSKRTHEVLQLLMLRILLAQIGMLSWHFPIDAKRIFRKSLAIPNNLRTFATMKQAIRVILSYIAAIILLPIAILCRIFRKK